MAGLSRRDFLKTSAGGAAALTIGFSLHGCGGAADDPLSPDPSIGGEVNAWLVITPDDRVTVRVAKAEMGQGVLTSLAMIVADELGCRWEDVRAEAADINRNLRSDRVYGKFLTDGSASVRGSRKRLRRAGANARMRLERAAAERWGVSADRCEARDGRVHGPAGETLRFGELVAAAAAIAIAPDELVLRDAATGIVGTPTPRLDVPAKVTDEATFGIDVRVPGMRYAAVRHGPVLGGRAARVDDSAALAMRGVDAVVTLDSGVAVVADSYYRATKALDALAVDWEHGENAGLTTASLRRRFLDAAQQPADVARETGDAMTAIGDAAQTVEAVYDVPFLAHACLEPMNCTVKIDADRVDVWVGTQDARAVVTAAAEVTGRAETDIHVHQQLLGGGFGRRISTDHVREALAIALATGGQPVQLIWSREEDMRQGYYRPMAALKLAAGITDAGRLDGLLVRAVTDSIFARHRPEALDDGFDPTSLMGLRDMPYTPGHLRVESRKLASGIPTWLWRSVGASQNTFALESFLDEVAIAAGRSPVALRRELLAGRTDARAVLDALVARADPDAPLPEGRGRGMALTEYAGTLLAQCIDVTVAPDGKLSVDRVVSVLDCGNVVNPLTVEEQIEGAVVFGLSAALSGRITVEDGRVVEGNYDRYRMQGMRDCPVIETHLNLSGGDLWGGIGEPGLPPVAPALVNAIYRACGKRIRSLPVEGHDLA